MTSDLQQSLSVGLHFLRLLIRTHTQPIQSLTLHRSLCPSDLTLLCYCCFSETLQDSELSSFSPFKQQLLSHPVRPLYWCVCVILPQHGRWSAINSLSGWIQLVFRLNGVTVIYLPQRILLKPLARTMLAACLCFESGCYANSVKSECSTPHRL